MKFIFDGYDLTLAVVFRRTLLFEYFDHDNQERAELVWQPTQSFFENMARESPKQITCFFGRQFHWPKKKGCSTRYLYATNQQSEVACLGTVFNPAAVRHYQADPRLTEYQLKAFKRRDKTKFSRGQLAHCIIPVEREEIDELALVQAAKKYFQSFAKKTLIPSLANTLICLLSAEKGARLEEEIIAKAKQSATHISNKEQNKKFIEDQMW